VARLNTGDIPIRPERAKDRARIREVTASAFAHHPGVADLVALIRAFSGYMPELSLVAEMKGDIIGHVMLSRADLVDEWGERHHDRFAGVGTPGGGDGLSSLRVYADREGQARLSTSLSGH